MWTPKDQGSTPHGAVLTGAQPLPPRVPEAVHFQIRCGLFLARQIFQNLNKKMHDHHSLGLSGLFVEFASCLPLWEARGIMFSTP